MKLLSCVLLAFLTICSSFKFASAEIIYSDNDYGCGWENYASPITIDNSYEIGTNIAIYASKGTGMVKIMQVIHNGDWDPEPGSLQNLVNEINYSTTISAINAGYATLGIADLSEINMLYLTGHSNFSLSGDEKNALKEYVNNGGVLFVDDCNNAIDNLFEEDLRILVQEMYGVNLHNMPINHAIYSSFYILNGSDFSYSSNGNGTEWNQEPLEWFNPVVLVNIDFDPNTLNLKSKGKYVTVYIEIKDYYDVNNISVDSILLNNKIQAEPSRTEIIYEGAHVYLMVKFDRTLVQNILQVGNNVAIVITGTLLDGTPFKGSDLIRVIKK